MPPLWEQAVSMLFALVMFLLSLNVLFPPPPPPKSCLLNSLMYF